MIYIAIVAALGAILFCLTQYRKSKNQNVEQDALQLAWKKKDYDAYLALLSEKIDKSRNRKEKNILATLKMEVYILRKEWQKMDALKKNVRLSELPKKIRVTFVCQYIIGTFLSERPQIAFKQMEYNAPLLAEAEANGTYALYINSVKALKAFYTNHLDESRKLFSELKEKNIPGDLYDPMCVDYLNRIEEAKKEAAAETE